MVFLPEIMDVLFDGLDMKIQEIRVKQLRRYEKARNVLFDAFKFGLPLGVGIVVLGQMAAGPHDPRHFGNRVLLRVTGVGETVLALASASMALSALLEGLVYFLRSRKSGRFTIWGIVPYVFVALLLGSGAVALGVVAVREWLRP